jgi:nicotinamidase-related amidase
MRVHGLIIDPQNDFCSQQTGTLVVPGADADMARVAALVRRIGADVEALHVTLDSHHHVDIAHAIWWRDPDGNHPAPFTIITVDHVESGAWQTTDPSASARSRAYVRQLAEQGRYPLCIWPYHCLIGSPGHAIVPDLHAALCDWEDRMARPVDYVLKGSNIWTEHYSAIQADVPDPEDPGTLRNDALLRSLFDADLVFVAGEAGSHCVANTMRDIAEAASVPLDLVAASPRGDEPARPMTRFVLLTDAISPVPGFESYQTQFLEEMRALGLRAATTTTVLSGGTDV